MISRFRIQSIGSAFLIIGAILITYLLHAPPVRAQESLRIAAVVNEEIISAFDLNARLRLVALMSRLPNTEETYRSLASATLRTLIDEKIKLQEAENLGISVTQDQLDNAVSVIEQRNRLPPGNLIPVLEKNGIDLETLFEQLRSDIVWTRIVTRKHRSSVTITDEEIDAMIAADEAARNQPRYRISEIVIPVESPEKLAEANAQIDSLRIQLQAGAEFSALAQSFSQSPSASRGGDVGWLRSDQIPEEVRSAVLALQPGQITVPIRVPTGFVVIKLNEIRAGGNRQQPDSVLKLNQLHLPLPKGSAPEVVSSYLTRARETTASAQGCTAFEAASKDVGSPLSGSLGEVNLSKLPPALRDAIASLPVGKSSAPIRTAEAVLVLMVCERRELPIPDKSMSREDAERRILSSRLAVYARQEIRELRRAAYVEIR